MIKKILHISGWAALWCGMLGLLGFAEIKRNQSLCRYADIRIDQLNAGFFITPAEALKMIEEQQGKITGKPVEKINAAKIEQLLNGNPYIARSEVYATLNGILEVRIIQKEPVARVFTNNNESFYIDSTGASMPLSDNYTPKVLVINGTINDTLLPALFKLAAYIRGNTFWNSEITQVYVDSVSQIILIPRVGSQRIILGNTDDMEQKFDRLWVFYHDGMNAAGKWNEYSTINLKYKHQIVCTKK